MGSPLFYGKNMNLELVNHKTPILLTPTQMVDFSNPPADLEGLSQAMVTLMMKKNGLGLASNQIGLPYSMFAMRGSPQHFVIINPRIVGTSAETVKLDEGCLTYPGLIVPIERPRHVRLRFQTPNGETLTKQFTDISARVVQHEIQHLLGLPFWSGISREKFDIALRKCYKKGFKMDISFKKG